MIYLSKIQNNNCIRKSNTILNRTHRPSFFFIKIVAGGCCREGNASRKTSLTKQRQETGINCTQEEEIPRIAFKSDRYAAV
jgi:hypothetical protein